MSEEHKIATRLQVSGRPVRKSRYTARKEAEFAVISALIERCFVRGLSITLYQHSDTHMRIILSYATDRGILAYIKTRGLYELILRRGTREVGWVRFAYGADRGPKDVIVDYSDTEFMAELIHGSIKQ